MKLLADKNWNVVLCGAMTSIRHGGTWLLLPNLAISPNNPDAGGLRISCGWILWYLWLDIAWWKWRGSRTELREG